MDFEFDNNLDFFGDNNLDFVKRHSASEKIIDFTNKIEVDDFMRFDIVEKLNFEIPDKDKSLFLVTTKPISLLDVVNYIETKKGMINCAYLFFYTINEKAANYTCNLSKRADVKIIISDLMNSQRTKERLVTSIFDENNVEIVFCHNHAKIASFKINDNYFTLTGSMNAGNNARIETLQIFNSKSMYDFVSSIYNSFKTKFEIKKRY